MDAAAGLAEIAGDDGRGEDADAGKAPGEEGARRFGHSKDQRDDLPQVVIAMAVTRDGIPVRCWTFPGNEQGQKIIRKVKDDLGAWNLRRLVWVADRGFASAANRACLARAAGATSTPRSSATPAPRPPRRWPARAATTKSPGPAGQGGLGAPQGRRGTIRAVHQRLVLRQQLVDVAAHALRRGYSM
jgi:hypothetical protein